MGGNVAKPKLFLDFFNSGEMCVIIEGFGFNAEGSMAAITSAEIKKFQIGRRSAKSCAIVEGFADRSRQLSKR